MTDHDRPEVTLVTMPFAELATPSVAIGILKAALDQAGISTRVVEAQLLFAERIGPGAFQSMKGALNLLVGDWMFSKAAFPDFAPNEDEYLDRVSGILGRHDPQRFIDYLLDLRYEAELFVDDLARQIVEERPRIVACTSVFQQHCAALALLRRIRELDPSILTMMGGSNCESEMGKATLVSFDWVDVVVSGDADDLIAPLCRMLLAEGAGKPAEELPPGVFAHDHRRRWRAGEALPATRYVLRDMADSPVPDYDGYFDTLRSSLANSVIFPGLPMETSRGCWWGQKNHCTFCGIESGSMRFRSKSADRVMAGSRAAGGALPDPAHQDRRPHPGHGLLQGPAAAAGRGEARLQDLLRGQSQSVAGAHEGPPRGGGALDPAGLRVAARRSAAAVRQGHDGGHQRAGAEVGEGAGHLGDLEHPDRASPANASSGTRR